MSICIRYVHKLSIKERFLGFIQVEELDALGLTNYIIEFLNSFGLDITKCISQSYDGASVMSGSTNGVQVRQEGNVISADEILKYSKLFKDEITLDSLPRPQLVALCRVLDLRPIGTTNFLRFKLRLKLRSLAIDDKKIQKEGVGTLNLSELQQACLARGMRAYGLTENRLQQQLTQWLDLSLNEKVPPSLLLISRAFSFTENIPISDLLKRAISELPDSVGVSTKADLGERDGTINNKAKLEAIKEEERKVAEEIKENLEVKKKELEELVDKAPVLKDTIGIIKEEEITSTDFKTLANAIENLSCEKKKLVVEKEEIKDLKGELNDYAKDVNNLQEVMIAEKNEKVRESKAANNLFNKVNYMIYKIEQVVNELELNESEIECCNVKNKVSIDEPTTVECELIKIKIDELISWVRKLQNVPDDEKIKKIAEILSKIDEDGDGSVRLDTVLKVIQMISTENVKLSKKEIDMIIQLVMKEEEMECLEKKN
ncbi:LETM1-like,EF-hand domain pair,Letm1 ribosome-binding domain,EF-hand domain,Domain of unknown function [Cinara cedri]|uniref:Mitochondrial proton/calcium exchanger protein n=1 Tax=Cinara cedri TaxID=506608 RepID=A0A5E4MH59_9HEMI|nr:LETM1-like,EF-hand domain pair,Letm1 ribosome-binding domain,EF-hand domain,Domain of unknown function [Cinara cedri]